MPIVIKFFDGNSSSNNSYAEIENNNYKNEFVFETYEFQRYDKINSFMYKNYNDI